MPKKDSHRNGKHLFFLNGESFPRPSYAFLWSRNEALFLLILFLPPTDLKLSDDNSCAFFPDTVRHQCILEQISDNISGKKWSSLPSNKICCICLGDNNSASRSRPLLVLRNAMFLSVLNEFVLFALALKAGGGSYRTLQIGLADACPLSRKM